MNRQQAPVSPYSQELAIAGNVQPSRLVRILLIGPELRVEELQTLLSGQEDMELLPPIADADDAIDVLTRISEASHIDVAIIEGEFCEEKKYPLLQVLPRHLRSLIIAPPLYPSEIKRLKAAGAYGYCPTEASSKHLVKAIRKIARGEKYFHPTSLGETRAHLSKNRQPIFFQERLNELVADIGWKLSDTEILILAHFDEANNKKIAQVIKRPVATVRSATTKLYQLLQQLSERSEEIPNRLVAYQVLLELSIIIYR